MLETWGKHKEDTSNFRYFENVVDALREEAAAGNLKNAIIFMYGQLHH
jgi:hypothetical protein